MIKTLSADRTRLGVMVAVVSSLALAINDVSVPFVYEAGFNAPTVVLLRYAFLAGTLVLLLPVIRHPIRLPQRYRWHAVGSGICSAIGTIALLSSFVYIPVSLAVVIMYIFPFLTALAEAAYYRRRPSVVELLCPLVGLAGIAIAIGFSPHALDPIGILLATTAAIAYGGSIFWNSIALRDCDGVTVTVYIAIVGASVAALFLVATGNIERPPLNLSAWLAIAFTCVFFTIAFLTLFKSVELVGGPVAAMIFNLEPVFVILLATTFLGESLSWQRVIGSGLVIGAVVFAEYWRNRRALG